VIPPVLALAREQAISFFGRANIRIGFQKIFGLGVSATMAPILRPWGFIYGIFFFWHGNGLFQVVAIRASFVYNNFIIVLGFLFDIFASLRPVIPAAGAIDHHTSATDLIGPTLFSRI
jgi:hypothetical protein